MRRLGFCIAATILTLFRADIGLPQVDHPPAVTAPPNALADGRRIIFLHGDYAHDVVMIENFR